MNLREWYEKEIQVHKMCIECTNVVHIHEQECSACTCTVFFYLTRLITPAKLAEIAPRSKKEDAGKFDVEMLMELPSLVAGVTRGTPEYMLGEEPEKPYVPMSDERDRT